MELGSVALGLIHVPDGTPIDTFRTLVKKCLFRTSDAVYSLPDRRQLALVLDDCKPEYIPGLIGRIEKGVGGSVRYGIAICPNDGVDPTHLVELAGRRLSRSE